MKAFSKQNLKNQENASQESQRSSKGELGGVASENEGVHSPSAAVNVVPLQRVGKMSFLKGKSCFSLAGAMNPHTVFSGSKVSVVSRACMLLRAACAAY